FTFPDGSERRFHLTGDDAVAGLFNALYETTLIPQLPAAIHDIATGGRTIIPLIAEDGIPFVNDTSEGAFLSYECADNGADIDGSKVRDLRAEPGQGGLLLLVGWNIFCDVWPVDPLPANFSTPVTSDIPTLVISGEYD